MRLDFVNECKRSERKSLVGIENPWVQSLQLNNKKLPIKGEFFNGDNYATNLELLLSEEYYTETMQTYFNIRKFLDNNHSLANSLPA